MSFLHPWALALGALAGVPLLLHLLRRRADRRVEFPALRYLRHAEQEHARSLRLRDLLLLALRMLLILLVALAAAGPLLGTGNAADHLPTDVALLLDNSASMARLVGDGTLLDTLRARARSTLRSAGRGDRFWILPAVGDPLVEGAGSASALTALRRLRQTDGAADLPDLVARGAAVLPADPDRERELQLLSDLQATDFPSPTSGGARSMPLVLLRADPAGPSANGAVTDVSAGAGRWVTEGSQPTLSVTAGWFGSAKDREADSAQLLLRLDGAAAGGAALPWGSSTVLGLPRLSVGPHSGRVELGPSGLRSDDARYFTLQVVPPPAVTFEGPADSYVDAALGTLRQAGRVTGGEEILVLEGTPGAEGGTEGQGAEAVVLIPPADPLQLSRFDGRLEALGVPWRLDVGEGHGDLTLEGPSAPPGLASVKVHRRYELRGSGPKSPGDTVLLRTSDGAPWLVRGSRGPGGSGGGSRYLLLASPLVPEATDLPTRPAMIPFLEALLLRWSPPRGWPSTDVLAGRPLDLPGGVVAIRPPGGESEPVEGGAPYLPALAGVYVAYLGDAGGGAPRDSTLFAANVPPPEFDLRALAPDSASELMPGGTVISAGPDSAAWASAIFRSRRGANRGPWLLLAAAVLALVEIWVASPEAEARSRRPMEVTGSRARQESS